MALVFDQAPIDEALLTVGYQSRRHLVYQALWSTPEVEHFLSISRYGVAKASLTARFGLRNPHAEAFSVKCLRSYGGDLFKVVKSSGSFDCKMNFSFERLSSEGRRWALYIPDFSSLELADILQGYIQERLLPVVRNV